VAVAEFMPFVRSDFLARLKIFAFKGIRVFLAGRSRP